MTLLFRVRQYRHQQSGTPGIIQKVDVTVLCHLGNSLYCNSLGGQIMYGMAPQLMCQRAGMMHDSIADII